IASEIITTPVLADGQVYLATLEGTLYCFQQDGGQLVWTKKHNATSSPVVYRGECYFSRRKEMTLAQAGKGATAQFEALGGTTNNYVFQGGGSAGGPGTNYNVDKLETKELAATERQADYLDAKKRVAVSRIEAANVANDASVGFAESKGAFAP